MRPALALSLSLALSAAGARAGAQAKEDPAPPTPMLRGVNYSDGFVLHDDRGAVRLYPRVSLSADLTGVAGAGVAAFRGADGARELSPRVVLRRGIIELGGGAFGFFDLKVGVEIDGRGTYADPLLPDAHDIKVGLQNAWINYEMGPALNIMAGIQPTPFSLERRTDPDDLAALEPSVASQLAVPFARVIGGTLWGVTLHKGFGYDVTGILGVGNTLPTGVSERGVAGRAFWRPFATSHPPVRVMDTSDPKDANANLDAEQRWIPLDRVQIGMSGRYTVRDGHSAEISRDDVTTARGVALFRRRFAGARGETQVILPSGAQWALGLEMSTVGFPGLTLTSEAYVFDDGTREAVAGKEAKTTERLGSIRGVGYYAEVSYICPLGLRDRQDLRHTRDVPYRLSRSLDQGLFPHPRRRDPVGVRTEIGALQTLQFAVRAGRVDATYAPTRGDDARAYGLSDSKSPAGKLDIWELSGVASMWFTRIVRLSASVRSYYAPPAGSAVTLPSAGSGGPPWIHEFGLRARMTL